VENGKSLLWRQISYYVVFLKDHPVIGDFFNRRRDEKGTTKRNKSLLPIKAVSKPTQRHG